MEVSQFVHLRMICESSLLIRSCLSWAADGCLSESTYSRPSPRNHCVAAEKLVKRWAMALRAVLRSVLILAPNWASLPLPSVQGSGPSITCRFFGRLSFEERRTDPLHCLPAFARLKFRRCKHSKIRLAATTMQRLGGAAGPSLAVVPNRHGATWHLRT